jgi:hypothetical protein
MAERRVARSHPDFGRLFGLAEEIAVAVSPQRWFNYREDTGDSPERLAAIEIKKDEMKDELDGGLFRDYLGCAE